MYKTFITLLLLGTLLSANEPKSAKLALKGKKIASTLCDISKLPSKKASIEQLIKEIKASKACPNLSASKLKAIAYYINNKKVNSSNETIRVPKGAKCPVCGMFVSKYPKWAAIMVIDNKHKYFDGVKDMMKYYFFDADFPYDRAKIKKMKVTNYYTLKAIDAKRAYYVYDSKVYGPMGRELIPFSTKKEALNFIRDHGGELMRFNQITPKLVMALDGIELR